MVDFPILQLCTNADFRTPLHELSSSGGVLSFLDGLDLSELYDLFLNSGADEILIDNIDLFANYHGPINNLKYLQRQAYPPYRSTPLSFRIDVAAHQLESAWHNMPATFDILLDNDGEINTEIAKWTNEKGQTLLQLVLRNYATWSQGGATEKFFDPSLEKQGLETVEDISKGRSYSFRHLSRKLISAGASLQSVDYDGHTILSGIITDLSFSPIRSVGKTFKLVNELKDEWLSDFLQSGVNLQEYGAWESLSLQNKDFNRLVRYHKDREDSEGGESGAPQRHKVTRFDIRLINFTYGPNPKDWILWFSEPSDPFAGDFWAMIEGEEHWRRFEKGWFFDDYYNDYFGVSGGWYFYEKRARSGEVAVSVDVLPIPGSWSTEF
jgi:hypothetical protein